MPEALVIRVLGDLDDADTKAGALEDDLRDVTDDTVNLQRPAGQRAPGAKGDPVTVGVIVLTMVGAGGFLTAAASQGGLFTKLADILNNYMNRGVEFEIETSDGAKIVAKGAKGDVEDLLRAHAWRAG